MKNIGTYPNLRMRRNRKADWIRRLISEHNLSANDLILPLFVKEGVKKSKLNDKKLRNIKNNQASSKLTSPVAMGLFAVLFTSLSNL